MNDNIPADDAHLLESLRLIWDLYFMLRHLESAGDRLTNIENGVEVECDWGFWADRCAEMLGFKMPNDLLN
jgi:hypothetical protein